MSQSLKAIYIHATFGTKGRKPTINEKIAPQLHAFMAGAFKKIDSPALIINSVPDHIHALFRMSKNETIAAIMEEVKKSSSLWMKQQKFGTQQFYWQKGYGAFSISGSHLDIVSRYIANQKEHHQTLTYKEEVQRLMEKYNVQEFNPDYYWD
ncbi:MAG TPA: transposase [Balneolaceae bacterium]|nr:transposase [Balneolaceae bacterium]